MVLWIHLTLVLSKTLDTVHMVFGSISLLPFSHEGHGRSAYLFLRLNLLLSNQNRCWEDTELFIMIGAGRNAVDRVTLATFCVCVCDAGGGWGEGEEQNMRTLEHM